MSHAPLFEDTDARTAAVHLKLVRRLTPSQRFGKMLSLTQLGREVLRDRLRREEGLADRRSQTARMAELLLPPEDCRRFRDGLVRRAGG